MKAALSRRASQGQLELRPSHGPATPQGRAGNDASRAEVLDEMPTMQVTATAPHDDQGVPARDGLRHVNGSLVSLLYYRHWAETQKDLMLLPAASD